MKENMGMITEDYCSQEVVKLLEEKGFNVEVGGMYVDKDNNFVHASIAPLKVKDYEKVWDDQYIPTCTHQMAMKKLRERHDLHIEVIYNFYYDEYKCCMYKTIGEYNYTEFYSTYEEAVEAALKYSLENLI